MGSCIKKPSLKQRLTMGQQLDNIQKQLQIQHDRSHINSLQSTMWIPSDAEHPAFGGSGQENPNRKAINIPTEYDPPHPLDRQVFVRDMKDRNHLRKQSHHNSFVKHNY